MANRCRAFSRPAMNLFKSAIPKPASRPAFSKPSTRPAFSAQPTNSSPSLFSRPLPQTGALMSLLSLHTAVSTARLTSCLGPHSNGCRSLSHELGQSVPSIRRPFNVERAEDVALI